MLFLRYIPLTPICNLILNLVLKILFCELLEQMFSQLFYLLHFVFPFWIYSIIKLTFFKRYFTCEYGSCKKYICHFLSLKFS